MKLLLKQIRIVDKGSAFNDHICDILIDNDRIAEIGTKIEAQSDWEVFDGSDAFVSNGFVDVFSHFNDPGNEQKEVLASGADAAIAGGYTQVFVLPNTNPILQDKAMIEYVAQKSKSLPITIHPIGAASKDLAGVTLSEMYDMHNSGAVAFSDGLKPVQSAGLFLKVLQYVKAFDGVLIQQPFDNTVSAHGLINEGVVSTQMGLYGLPAVSEEIMIQRDIELLRYTGSRLHITGVSSARGIDLIRNAKAEGLKLTCSVTPYNLTFTDEDLQSYDTNLKVNPPIRTSFDRDALRTAVMDGTVDLIATHHFPQHWDDKVCEFEHAAEGMIGLQTAFAAVNTAIPNLSADRLASLFGAKARSIFALDNPTIEVGQPADLTLFAKEGETMLTKANNKSKSANSAYFDKALKGSILGVVAKGNFRKVNA